MGEAMLMAAPNELQGKLDELSPTHVAVAYLGQDWKKYLTNLESLEEIIVSPTIGSYPGALDELLAKSTEHDYKVYFSEKLHAKLYIGESACLMGSPNLSHNGFGGGLNEAAIYLEDVQYVHNAKELFEQFKVGAVENRDHQLTMVKKLWSKWQRMQRERIAPKEAGNRETPNLANWHHGSERIILVWGFHGPSIKINTRVVREVVPEMDDDPYAFFYDYLDFAQNDDIQKGDWLLYWIAKGDGTPDKRSGLYAEWIQVDNVISNGAVADQNGYSTLAVTMPKGTGEDIPPPFQLDELAIKLIHQLLDSDDFQSLKPNDDELWRYADVREENSRFFDTLQNIYRKEAANQ